MSVFSAIKRAVLRAEGTHITEAYSSTDQVSLEMADLANEVAEDIAKGYDWRDLTKVHTITGDGVQTAFLKPADYDRMVGSSAVDDVANWFWGYHPFRSVNEWMQFVNGGYGLMQPGGWIIIGGEYQFYPAPTGDATFPYISGWYARSESGVIKEEFTADDDTFALDERLLTLGLIWRWKAQKGLEYSEDMASYNLALSQAQARDKGARVIERRIPRIGFGTPTIAIAAGGTGTDTDYVAIYEGNK